MATDEKWHGQGTAGSHRSDTGRRPVAGRFRFPERRTSRIVALAAALAGLAACTPPAEVGQSDGAHGGQGGESGESGGASSGGNAPSAGGRASGGTPTSGGSGAGGGASGGAEPSLDGSCSERGRLACDITNAAQTLVCSKGSWVSGGTCDEGEACRPTSGRCASMVVACEGKLAGDLACNDQDELIKCGPNLVSFELIEACAGRCVESNAGAACVVATCGDGKAHPGEACDDGNTNNSDSCTELCQAPSCGDGFKQSGEACDDGNADNADACTELCTSAACGDGWTQAGEDCDDGDSDNTDACTELCRAPFCGDGFLQSGEACDDANAGGLDGCSSACAWEVSELSAGGGLACALRADGKVKCWGNNSGGGLGLGDMSARGDAAAEMGAALPAVDLGDGASATQVVTGNGYACALLQGGSLKCWGSNSLGSLGLGDAGNRGDAPGEMGQTLPAVDLGSGLSALQLAAGTAHTCALLSDSSVKCWGYNTWGQLGLGDVSLRGDGPNEMGSLLPAVNLGAGRTATRVAAGDAHTCAILDDSSVRCWGNNNYGQLGLGDADSRGDEAGEMGASLPEVHVSVDHVATSLALGYYHTCALLDDASVKCWGDNVYGQLGLGDTVRRGDGPGEMGASLPTVDLGPGRTAAALVTGRVHVCALLDNGSVKCWGDNSYGQLGLGDASPRGDQPSEMGSALPAVDLGSGRSAIHLTAGGNQTCALLNDTSVKCWGSNGTGQLGLGDTSNRGDQAGEMGDALPTVSLW